MFLTWNSANTASVVPTQGWSGDFTLSGVRTVVLAQTTTFGIRCIGPGGQADTTVTVTVTEPNCPSVIDYAPRGGSLTVSHTLQVTVENWPSGLTNCIPFWYSNDPAIVSIAGADTVTIINGQQYYGGINAVLRAIWLGTTRIFTQTSIVTPQVRMGYDWTVVTSSVAAVLGIHSKGPTPMLKYMNVPGITQTFIQPIE